MIALGSYVFNAAYHTPLEVQLAPKQEVRFSVFGLNGVGKIIGGRTSRIIDITATYCNFPSELAILAALDADDSQKGGTPDTLVVSGGFATNCHLIGLNVPKGAIFRDGVTGLWVAVNVSLIFEQLVA